MLSEKHKPYQNPDITRRWSPFFFLRPIHKQENGKNLVKQYCKCKNAPRYPKFSSIPKKFKTLSWIFPQPRTCRRTLAVVSSSKATAAAMANPSETPKMQSFTDLSNHHSHRNRNASNSIRSGVVEAFSSWNSKTGVPPRGFHSVALEVKRYNMLFRVLYCTVHLYIRNGERRPNFGIESGRRHSGKKSSNFCKVPIQVSETSKLFFQKSSSSKGIHPIEVLNYFVTRHVSKFGRFPHSMCRGQGGMIMLLWCGLSLLFVFLCSSVRVLWVLGFSRGWVLNIPTANTFHIYMITSKYQWPQ